mmetsp:Transcript_38416/g.105820  ORF Transcript_38416/g.105820 Transcript_38416/m.105820 type:complete len:223 (-) Transcript_38416:12-680(-)
MRTFVSNPERGQSQAQLGRFGRQPGSASEAPASRAEVVVCHALIFRGSASCCWAASKDLSTTARDAAAVASPAVGVVGAVARVPRVLVSVTAGRAPVVSARSSKGPKFGARWARRPGNSFGGELLLFRRVALLGVATRHSIDAVSDCSACPFCERSPSKESCDPSAEVWAAPASTSARGGCSIRSLSSSWGRTAAGEPGVAIRGEKMDAAPHSQPQKKNDDP